MKIYFLVSVIIMILISSTIAMSEGITETTFGTFVGLKDAGEGNVEIVVKNNSGMYENFALDRYNKDLATPDSKGKSITVNWIEGW